MKKFSIEDFLTEESVHIPLPEPDHRANIHFICRELGRNVDQYWCEEICKECKNE